MKNVFLVMLCSIVFTTAYSQQAPVLAQGKIKGMVIDATLRTPVEFATVALHNAADSSLITGTVSAANGAFALDNVAYGKYYIIAQFVGYQKYISPAFTIDADNKSVQLDTLHMNQVVTKVDDVTIVADRNAVEYKIDKKVVNVAQMPQAAGGSAVDALRNVPSVQVDAEGNVSIQGNSNFTVLIDGKPSVLSGNDILKQTPANQIENIEIISNPSAKYDPEGTAGIINIVMKKGQGNGMSGVINGMIGTGNKYSTDILLNFRSSKINYFFGGDIRQHQMKMESEAYRETPMSGDTISKLDFDTKRKMRHNNMSFKTGFDLYLPAENTVSLSTQIGRWGNVRGWTTLNHEYNNLGDYNNYNQSITNGEMEGYYTNASLTHLKKFNDKGHQLNTNLFFNGWRGRNDEESNLHITDAQWNHIQMNAEDNMVNRQSQRGEARFKIDYTLPMGDSKIEAGHQTTLRLMEQKYNYYDFDTDKKDWVLNTNKTNAFDYDLNIYALYATYGGKISDFNYQVGLRGEYMNRFMIQQTTKEEYTVERFDYYPSVSLSRQLTKTQQLQASYSKRVNNPNEFQLNPFPMMADKYMMNKGNPNLQPEFIHSYELNYMYRLPIGFFSVNSYYKKTINSISMSFYKDDQNRLVQTSTNLDSYYAAGADLSANLDVKKWWNIFTSLSMYNYGLDDENVSDKLPARTNALNVRLANTFKLKSLTTISLNTGYQGAQWLAQGRMGESWNLGLSVKQELFKRKASVTLNINNPFYLNKFSVTLVDSQVSGYLHQRMESPMIQLSASYKINNYKASQRNDDSMRDMNQGGGMF